jgi:chromosome segregation ATPase
MDGLILDEAFEQPTKLAVKINFLQHEKDNLEETVREMSDNIKVYKRIIEQLTEAAQTKVENADGVVSEIVVKLTRLNDGLQ